MARHNRISEEKRNEIVACRVSNPTWTRTQIAQQFGISGPGVSKVLKSAGVAFVPEGAASPITDAVRQGVIDVRTSDPTVTVEAIATKYGIAEVSVIRILKSAGKLLTSKQKAANVWSARLKNEPNAVDIFIKNTRTPEVEAKRIKALRSAYTNKMEDIRGVDEIGFLDRLAKDNGGVRLSSYAGSKTKVKWRCAKSHEFETIPNSVQQGRWCPRCAWAGPSPEQLEIAAYIRSLVPDAEMIVDDRKTIAPLELDIWLPELKFAFEYNGLWWHCSENKEPGDHQRKALACYAKGVSLLAVYGDEWANKSELIKAMIRWRLHRFSGVTIRASKLELVHLVKNKQFKDFFNRNHLDGHAKADHALALCENGVIRACISFRTTPSGETEIARLATDYDYNIHGGVSRLLAASPRPLVSFSNNRLSSGNVYQKMGFKELKTKDMRPSYWYTDLKQRIWRFRCRRIKDPEILSQFPTEEAQVKEGVISMKIFGDTRKLYKIEDYGRRKWILS